MTALAGEAPREGASWLLMLVAPAQLREVRFLLTSFAPAAGGDQVVPGDLLREGAALLLTVLAPAAGAAVLAALLVGLLLQRIGVTDPAPALVARAAAVVAVLAWAGERWLAGGAAWTRGLWAALPAIGRGTG